MEIKENENKNLCAECGGMCCKKCGCDYFVTYSEGFKRVLNKSKNPLLVLNKSKK